MKHSTLIKAVDKAYKDYNASSGAETKVRGELYDAYDTAVDTLVEATNGELTAHQTDPLNANNLSRGFDLKGKTYNEMCEIEGNIAFGQ